MSSIISGSFFGFNMILSGNNIRQDPLDLINLLIHGEQTARLTQVFNVELTDAQVNALDYTNAIYDSNTVMLARYENNLNAGNSINVGEDINEWEIRRLDVATNVLEDLGSVPVATTNINDFTAVRDRTYRYEVFGRTDNLFTEAVISDDISPSFFGWYLIDVTTNESIRFDLDVQSGTLSNVRDVTEHQTFAQYPSIAFGRRNYYRGTIRAFGGMVDCTGTVTDNNGVIFDADYQETLKTFLNNGNEKIMKDRKGIIYRVQTWGANIDYNDDIGQQPYSISWNFAEVGDVSARISN